jgi:WD40 repeat protein
MQMKSFWQHFSRAGFTAFAALWFGLLPRIADSDAAFGKLLGSNDVATKIAELSERYGAEIPPGVAFSPDGKYVAVSSDHENINIWEWRRNRIEETIVKPKGFTEGQIANPLAYSPDGRWLANSEGPGDAHEAIRVWDTATWKVAADIIDPTPMISVGATFTPDGKFLVRSAQRTVLPGDNLILHAVGTWQQVWAIQLQSNFEPDSLAISSDGRLAAIGGAQASVPNVADIAEKIRQMKRSPTIDLIDLQQRRIVRTIHTEAQGCIAWAPDNLRIAVAGWSRVELFNTQSGDRLISEPWSDSSHMNVQFTPDGRFFVESDMNGKGTGRGVRIWDGQHAKLLQEIKGDVGSIAISRDSKYLALGATGRTTVWQFKAAELPR